METNNPRKGSQVTIKRHPDLKVAPRYTPEWKELVLKDVVITEKGTEGGLPLLDFVLKDNEGKEYFFMITGRIVNSISAAVKGTNLRNHGVEEP